MYRVYGSNHLPEIATRVLAKFAEEQKMNITVHNPNDNARFHSPDSNTRSLTVYFYSSAAVGPYSGGEENIFKYVFGQRLSPDQWSGVSPSLIGTYITDSDDRVVAEVVENTLYVLFDLFPDGGYSWTQAEEILEKILEGFAKLPPLEVRNKDRLAKIQMLRRNTQREFELIFVDDVTHSRSDIAKQLALLREMAVGDLIVYDGEVRIPLGRKKAIRNWRDYPPEKVDLGQMFFVLRFGDKWSKEISIHHLTPDKVASHNYIYSDGDYCLGNVDDGVTNLMAQYEIAFAAQAVKLFIEVVN